MNAREGVATNVSEETGAWPLEMTAPEGVGLSSQRLERVASLMNGWVSTGIIAGGVSLVARHDKIAHLECFGMMDAEAGTPMRDDAIFRIYSMSKPITCAAVLALYEESAFFLDDPVKKFIPEFAKLKVKEIDPDGRERLVELKRDVTIHDLLTHTGGLTYETVHDAPAAGWDLAAWIPAFCEVPLSHQPGEKWQYSASNDVLGRLVEIASGKPLDVFLEERICAPLGMTDTAFYVPPDKQNRLAAIYDQTEDGKIVRKTVEDRPYTEKPVFLSGGGGLVSTTSDYLRFCLMLLGDGAFQGSRILSRKTVELMRQDHLPPGHSGIVPFKFGYGLGVSVLRSLAEKQGIGSVGEFGWGGAACTDAWIDPQEDMISLIMMQLRPTLPMRLTKKIKVAFCQAIAD